MKAELLQRAVDDTAAVVRTTATWRKAAAGAVLGKSGLGKTKGGKADKAAEAAAIKSERDAAKAIKAAKELLAAEKKVANRLWSAAIFRGG